MSDGFDGLQSYVAPKYRTGFQIKQGKNEGSGRGRADEKQHCAYSTYYMPPRWACVGNSCGRVRDTALGRRSKRPLVQGISATHSTEENHAQRSCFSPFLLISFSPFDVARWMSRIQSRREPRKLWVGQNDLNF